MPKASHTKSQIISAIQATTRRLRRTPTRSEFERLSGIHWTKVQRLFGGYRVAVREAGLEPDPGGIRIDTAAMLVDFARVAREVGRHPTRDEYERLGRYASASLETRFQRWSAVRMKLLEFAEAGGLGREWKDVVEKLKNGPVPRRGGGMGWRNRKPNPKPLKHRGTEEAEEDGPQMNAHPRQAGTGEHGSESESHSPQMKADPRQAGTGERRLELGNQEGRRHRATSPTSCPNKPTSGLPGTPTSHVIRESQPEAEPNPGDVTGREQQMNADQRGSERALPEIAHEGTSNSGNSNHELQVEQMRPELLLPELRGMRCVTRTILWALCAERTGRALEMRALEGGVAEQESNTGDHNFRNRWDGADSRQALEAGTVREATGKSGALGNANGGEPAHYGATQTRRSYAGAMAGKMDIAASAEIAAGENKARFWNSYFPRRVLPGRPLLGAPLMRNGLMYEPVNEMGVVFLFGMMAEKLGFWVESLQAGFPDCEAKLEVEPGRWQHVRIEFEFESRKFRDHRHDPAKCDMIVCWRHNWKGCPPGIQVVELRGMMQSPRSHVIADIADIGKNPRRFTADGRG